MSDRLEKASNTERRTARVAQLHRVAMDSDLLATELAAWEQRVQFIRPVDRATLAAAISSARACAAQCQLLAERMEGAA